MSYLFNRGIHPKDKKELTADLPFEVMSAPAKVYIPLCQHIGAPAKARVSVGDRVKAGTLIGEATGFISANVHSSVSGTVVAIEQRENAAGRKIDHIVIENDGLYEEEALPPLENPTKMDIFTRCYDAGIVGMGGATFPTHVKIQPNKPIHTLIINGAECEPYITADYRMMLEHPKEIVEGISYIKTVLGAQKVVIGIEDNKPKAIDAMQAAVAGTDITVQKLKTKYPQGGEKQLIHAVTKLKVPWTGLPADVGVIVVNVTTAFAVYEAIKLGKPSYTRFMTVSGKGIKRPANLIVRVGTPFEDVVDYLGHNDYVKAIVGGPMMGLSIANLNPVVAKGNSSLLLLDKSEEREIEPTPCINCGRCAMACPMRLIPMMTDRLILKDKIADSYKYHPQCCIECGCCAYVCPADRPLVQSQRLAKKLIKERMQ
ncbi:MAG TPA: electron transport complex subunit RsxC [Clostridia bacterium]|mgnify:FL=1|nr:electron transport complex subunit RsxC [Clostridia bacterium]